MFSARDWNQLQSMVSSVSGGKIEMEAKFGSFISKTRRKIGPERGRTSSTFVSSVPWHAFDSLRTQLRQKGVPTLFETSTDFRQGDVRKRVVGDAVFWERKTSQHWNVERYGMRISVSAEISIEPLEPWTPGTIRAKKRESFFLDSVRVDLTEVRMSIQGEDRSTWEVEAELLGLDDRISWDDKFGKFHSTVANLYRLLYDTIEIYTVYERDRLGVFLNRILGGRPGPKLDFGLVAQARDLKLRDMVWGGLMGNKKTWVDDQGQVHSRGTSYTATHKADGMRKWLVFDEIGIWLVFPPQEFDLILRWTEANHDRTLSGSVLDGEKIPFEKRKFGAPTSYRWFVIFDCLAIQGDKGVQFQSHRERLEHATLLLRRVSDRTDSRRLAIEFKKFYPLDSVEQFYSTMQLMRDSKDSLPYEEDGLVFTPEEVPYNPLRKYKKPPPLSERSLVRLPDICKWKPQEKLTIDFYISWEGPDRTLSFYSVREDKTWERFQGTDFYPLEPSMMPSGPAWLNEAPTGTVVEFAWNDDTLQFIPLRIRYDKRFPNKTDIALDVWGDIHQPIEEETLTGDNFILLQRYHNRIKRSLFSLLPSGSTLLDVGSGRGGDVNKWTRFSRIVAVEPNEEHRTELERRLRLSGLLDRVQIVPAGAEETDVITQAVQEWIGGPADAISLMLSMTFFWETRTKFQAFLQTLEQNLAPGGRVLFLTMDGDTVEEAFTPYFRSIPYQKMIFHERSPGVGYATLELEETPFVPDQGRALHIYIQDTIVGKRGEPQVEYLVHLQDVELEGGKFRPLSRVTYRADREKFLSDAEKDFSLLYSFGWFQDRTPPAPREIGFRWVPRPITERLRGKEEEILEKMFSYEPVPLELPSEPRPLGTAELQFSFRCHPTEISKRLEPLRDLPYERICTTLYPELERKRTEDSENSVFHAFLYATHDKYRKALEKGGEAVSQFLSSYRTRKAFETTQYDPLVGRPEVNRWLTTDVGYYVSKFLSTMEYVQQEMLRFSRDPKGYLVEQGYILLSAEGEFVERETGNLLEAKDLEDSEFWRDRILDRIVRETGDYSVGGVIRWWKGSLLRGSSEVEKEYFRSMAHLDSYHLWILSTGTSNRDVVVRQEMGSKIDPSVALLFFEQEQVYETLFTRSTKQSGAGDFTFGADHPLQKRLEEIQPFDALDRVYSALTEEQRAEVEALSDDPSAFFTRLLEYETLHALQTFRDRLRSYDPESFEFQAGNEFLNSKSQIQGSKMREAFYPREKDQEILYAWLQSLWEQDVVGIREVWVP